MAVFACSCVPAQLTQHAVSGLSFLGGSSPQRLCRPALSPHNQPLSHPRVGCHGAEQVTGKVSIFTTFGTDLTVVLLRYATVQTIGSARGTAVLVPPPQVASSNPSNETPYAMPRRHIGLNSLAPTTNIFCFFFMISPQLFSVSM